MRKWFHAIGACGKSTANVAKMFKDMGWFVTGTDLQYLPPASTILEKAGIPFELGYHYSHLTREFWEKKLGKILNIPEVPDLGLIVETASSKNKELLFAKSKGIDIRPFSQILGEYLIKENSIVVAGTAGKTTTTALAVSILEALGKEPSYMIGADVIGFSESLKNTSSDWSVIEGDEFHSKELSRGAKFLEYKPKYLIITNIGWEHQDVFPTQQDYNNEFRKLVELLPENGLIVAKANDKNINEVVKHAKCRVIRYRGDGEEKVMESERNRVWRVEKNNGVNKIYDDFGKEVFSFKTNLIGEYNLENILAVSALIKTIFRYAEESKIIEAIEQFKGAKKRLEIVHKSENLIVVDDFGVAPDRARNSITTLRNEFPEYKIIAVFEPNSGSRVFNHELFNSMYKNTFNDAELVVIPDLSELNEELVSTDVIVSRLKHLGFKTIHIESSRLDGDLKELLASEYEDQKVLIIFFSSYRLTKIAEDFVEDSV